MWIRLIAAVCALLLLAGCPPGAQNAGKPADPSVPAARLPARSKLLAYDKLHLGMTGLEIAQLYNAPEGKGQGFQRLVQDFQGVQHHIVKFADKAGQPSRRLVLALLRDELYEIVDRRDHLTAAQAKAWRDSLVKQYGKPDSEPVAGAQWSWGPENGLLLTLTQDNASDEAMSANVVLVSQPYEDAAYSYLADWQKAHPEYKAEELPF
jgi:hypothetical protein